MYYAGISRELRRSAGAIQRRCHDLGLKERPVRESPHNLGENRFKARYQRPEKNGDIGWKGLAAVPWRESREAAQADLDRLAEKKGWKEWLG